MEESEEETRNGIERSRGKIFIAETGKESIKEIKKE